MAHRLGLLAMSEWTRFDGWCASRNVDPLELPLARAFNLIYYWAVQTMDAEQRDNFDAWLSTGPAPTASGGSRRPTGDWSRDAELAQFKRA